MRALVLIARPRRLTRRAAARLADELHWRGFEVDTADAGETQDATPHDLVVVAVGALVVPRGRVRPAADLERLLGGLRGLEGCPVALLLISATGLRGRPGALRETIRRHGGVPLPVGHAAALGGSGIVDLAAECMTRVPPLARHRPPG